LFIATFRGSSDYCWQHIIHLIRRTILPISLITAWEGGHVPSMWLMKSHKSKSKRLLLSDVFHVNSKTVFCSLCSLQVTGLCLQVKQSVSSLVLCIASCLHGVACCKWVNIRCFGCHVFHKKKSPHLCGWICWQIKGQIWDLT